MPINADADFVLAQKKYEEARTLEEKIKYLREMLSTAPTHKGAEKLRKELTQRMVRLRKELEKQKTKKKGRKSLAVKKQGFQVVIIGFPNTGKSSLLKKLTNAEPVIADYPFTTKKPEVGMMDYEGAKLQLVEIPALLPGASEKQAELLSIVLNADGVILVYENEEQKQALMNELYLFGIDKPVMFLEKGSVPKPRDLFNFFNLIRVYTKEPGEEPERDNPLVLKRGSTVLDAGKEIHKDFVRKFKYARVWGSTKFPGQRVDKDHVLKDGDVIEFHVK